MKNIFHGFWRAIIWWKIKIWQKIADTSFKEYIKQNIMAVLRKANSLSVAICRLIKKSIMKKKKEDPGEKITQTYTAQCLWGFNKKQCYVVHIIELLLHQKRLK